MSKKSGKLATIQMPNGDIEVDNRCKTTKKNKYKYKLNKRQKIYLFKLNKFN